MAKMRYPIGIQTFSDIIEEGFTYVDKTALIPDLLRHGKYIFLSRPRRFGKSLLLSTLEAYFEGRRHLFKGLALDGMDVDWTPSPVLHLDFNTGYYVALEGLVARFHATLRQYEEAYGLPIGAENTRDIPLRLEAVIRTAYEQTGRKVVVLVDEYDKPLLAVEEGGEVFQQYQRLLKSFYGNLKSMDRYIRFVFITGVARFSKVSIFSDFNNLDDISLENEFADICGWTQEELLRTFTPGIQALADEREEDFDTTLNALREYYDGYMFTPKGSRLYNPFSVLRALKAKEIDPYWFSTGSPYFLVRRFKDMEIFPPEISGRKCTREELTAVGFNDSDPVPLMFQTGYLTISSYDRESGLYELRFPNREVETGFYRDLLPVYVPQVRDSGSPFSFVKFKEDLYLGRPADFMQRLATMLKGLPGEDHCESAYRAITYLLTVLCATRASAESHGYLGRSDIEAATGSYVYVFEFKYNRTVSEAMQQIIDRDYAGRYALDQRTVYLIAANFNEKKNDRGLHYEIMMLTK